MRKGRNDSKVILNLDTNDWKGIHRYKTILSDHPWPSGKPKNAQTRDHWMRTNMKPRYGTLTAKQLIELPVGELAADDAVLVMWATWMHLDLALKCIDAYGFRYCAGFPWLKTVKTSNFEWERYAEDSRHRFMPAPIYGPGVWAQGCTELILIARRGKPFGKMGNPRPARKGIIIAPRQEHSHKPEELQTWIDSKFPGPKIELFARRTRPGWSSWGEEVSASVNYDY